MKYTLTTEQGNEYTLKILKRKEKSYGHSLDFALIFTNDNPEGKESFCYWCDFMDNTEEEDPILKDFEEYPLTLY